VFLRTEVSMVWRTTAMPARLTRLWTQQLYREYAHILHWYDLTNALAPVALAIEPITHYGEWRSATRTIVIADHLIRDYPWNVVLEVLKHEMAHQYVHEVCGLASARPHGDAFQDACHRLGVPAWAASASGTLPPEIGHTITRQLSAEEERLLRRAEKLLALAGSTHEHEAQLAMQRAQELFAKHHFASLRVRQGSDMTYTILRLKRKKIWTYEKMIISLLVRHFFVYIVHFTEFCPEHCTDYKALDMMGAPENVAMADYVFHFLQRAAEELWEQHVKASPGAHKPSFQRGVIQGFDEKLQETPMEATVAQDKGMAVPDVTVLVAAGRALIENTIGRQRWPKVSRRGAGSGRFDTRSFEAGEAEGQKIVLHKGISASHGNRGRLLPRTS
jgi:SprT-like family protein/uncharacterized protein DUF2786